MESESYRVAVQSRAPGLVSTKSVLPPGQEHLPLVKEIEIIHRLFLVNCYLLHVPRLPSQPASNVVGLGIH